ncbi:hypothetical protein MTO96_016460 [Rhipicephalus appendiculatus]
MYAYVRFRDDNHRAVVETTDFRNFNPKHKDGFENKWYEVFWQDEVQSDYFKAQVVRLYEQVRCSKVGTPPEKNGQLATTVKHSSSAVLSRVHNTPQKSHEEFLDEVLVPPSPEDGAAMCHERASEEGNLVPFATVGTEVFLGNGVKISRATFNHLMSRPKDSIFVREASVAIFSTAGLLGRSVTGSVSNRTKTDPKPALDSLKYEALSGMC